MKELEHSLKQFKSLKSYNDIIQIEFQAKLTELETQKENTINSLQEEIKSLKKEKMELSAGEEVII